MSHDPAQFLFMTCQPGAESALKEEVARTEAEWRLAYSRPGFVTFKLPGIQAVDDKQLAARNWALARAHGLSIGKVTGSQMAVLAQRIWEITDGLSIEDVHVWQRDAERGDDANSAPGVTPLATEIETAIRAAAPAASEKLRQPMQDKRRPTARSARVLDVVVVEPNEWWIGYHRAVTPPQRWPGGAIPVRVPPHAVSRAYGKMAEALAWSGLPITAEDECVELGCAPGGASQALLDRGCFVTGIDPAEVDPIVLEHPRFRHLRKRGKEVRRGEFIGVRWLVADVNLAPSYTLDAVEAIVNHPGVAIRGLVLTLKLADWGLVERLAEYAARVHGWGYRDVRMRQLARGGQEVCLVALRRKELRKINRKSKTGRDGRKKSSSVAGKASTGGQLRLDPPHNTASAPHF